MSYYENLVRRPIYVDVELTNEILTLSVKAGSYSNQKYLCDNSIQCEYMAQSKNKKKLEKK